jgi:glycosyltransferase involved in cell wall biosynthesis
MKVLWISQNLPYPPKRGVLLRNYHLLKEASKFAEVSLIAILRQDILPFFNSDTAARALNEFCRSVEIVRLPVEDSRLRFLWVVFESLFTKAPFTVNWATSSVLFDAVERAVARAAYDVTYFDTIGLAGYRRLAINSARVLNHHNIESGLFERRVSYEKSLLKRLYLRLEGQKLREYEATTVKDFDTNLVVSSLDASRLEEICQGASTSVVPNGVDLDYFRGSGQPPEPGRLVMVSGMNWHPNLDAVLFMIRSIWPPLSQAMPNVKLTVVGASPPREVINLANRDPRITVTGFVDDVRPYIDRAQVYLCPMRHGGGTRLKVLDALSMGAAMVATTMALEGIGVCPDRDVLVADTPEQFVRQVIRVVQDDLLRRQLGENGRSFVEREFSWAIVGRQLQGAFDRAASNKCQRG